MVRGGEDYEVIFEYDPDSQSWSAECTCPMVYDCKHSYAAMLALRTNPSKLSAPAPSGRAKSGAKPKGKSKNAVAPAREEPQPPPSPLSTALTQALGRRLDHAEINYVPYQLEGFHFLAYLTANHFGGVLADDMGLGKTLLSPGARQRRPAKSRKCQSQRAAGPARAGDG